MKFKKDGKVFESAAEALDNAFDCSDCENAAGCPVGREGMMHGVDCCTYVEAYPAEAARLMGYEVVEEETGWTLAEDGDGVVCPHCGADFCTLVYNAEEFIFCPSCGKKVKKEANMDKQKPLICEVLGVEVGERFSVKDEEAGYDSCDIFIDDSGVAQAEHKTGVIAPAILMIHAINYPASIIRKPRFTEQEVADARAIMRLFFCGKRATLVRGSISDELFIDYGSGPEDTGLNPELFPSIQPGQSVKLSDIVGGEV